MSQKYGPTDRYEILPGRGKRSPRSHRELHGGKLQDYSIRDDKIPTGELTTKSYADLSVTRSKIDDYAVNEDKIPTGELTYRSMKTDSGTETAVPDTDTEVAHGLGVVPAELVLTPQTTGVTGFVLESARSATSITIRANTSGVDVKWCVIA